jgi:hypothetical protein
MSFSDAIARYSTCATSEAQSPKTVKETVACVRRFSQFLGGDPTLGDIGADDLRRFILALQKREAYAQQSGLPLSGSRSNRHSVSRECRGGVIMALCIGGVKTIPSCSASCCPWKIAGMEDSIEENITMSRHRRCYLVPFLSSISSAHR